MFELMFRLQHDCPFTDLSKEFPDATIIHWCNGRTDVFEVTSKDFESLNGASRELEKITYSVGGRVVHVSSDKNSAKILTRVDKGNCICFRAIRKRKTVPITAQIERSHCLQAWPHLFSEGWEHYRVYALRAEDLKMLFGRLSKASRFEIIYKKTVKEERIRDVFTVSLQSLFAGLTSKQLTAILEALENGYYSIPRKTTVEEIARLKGIPRTTYEEHVRKAENKILNSVAPFIKPYAGK